jgi:hypothetical protein
VLVFLLFTFYVTWKVDNGLGGGGAAGGRREGAGEGARCFVGLATQGAIARSHGRETGDFRLATQECR